MALLARFVGVGKKIKVQVSSGVDSVRLKFGTDTAVTSGVLFSSAVAPDAQGFAELTVPNSLTDGATYHYRVEMTTNGTATLDSETPVGRYVTAPTGPTSFSFCAASCANTLGPPAMNSIASRNDELFFMLGDFWYADGTAKTIANYRTQMGQQLRTPEFQGVFAKTRSVMIPSDHDFGMQNGANGDDQTARTLYNQVHREMIAAPLQASTGVYMTFVWGRVRFIVMDTRSFSSAFNAANNASKTMLGATQKQWVKNTVEAATEPLILLIGDSPWTGPAMDSADRWQGYDDERQELGRFFANSGKNLAYIAGDMHAVAADSGKTAHSPGELPVFQCAPLFNTASLKGEPYSEGVYPAAGNSLVKQYGRFIVTDTGGDTINLAFTGYSADTETARVTYARDFKVNAADGSGGVGATIKIASANLYVGNTPAEAKEDILKLADLGVELMGLQEMGETGRREMLQSLDGWDGNIPGESTDAEATPIIWKSSVFSKIDMGAELAAPATNVGDEGAGPSTLRAKFIVWAKLKHIASGQVVILLNTHLPPSVESHGHPTSDPQRAKRLQVYEQQMTKLQDVVRAKRDQGFLFITGDFNVNYRYDSQVQSHLFPYSRFEEVNVWANWRGLGTPSTEPLGTEGSGSRLIDYVAYSRKKLLTPKSHKIITIKSDHNAVTTVFQIGSSTTTGDNEEDPAQTQTPTPTPPGTDLSSLPDPSDPSYPTGTPTELLPADPFNRLGLNVEQERFRNEAYRYVLVDVLTDEFLAELPFTGVTWGQKVSGAGEFTGSIYLGDELPVEGVHWATIPGKTSIYVLREDKVVFGGPIWNRDYQVDTRTLNIQAATWESYLFRRYVWHTLAYTGVTDQYDIVRDLIYQMNHDFGGGVATDEVTAALINADVKIEVESRISGRTQDAQTWIGSEMQTVGELLTQYSDNEYGFEWNIHVLWDANLNRFRKLFKFRDAPPGLYPADVPYTGPRPGLETNVFEHPGNVMTLQLTESADNASTRYFVLGGAPQGVDVPDTFKPRGSWNNSTFLSSYWPIIEAVESSKHPNVADPQTLRKYARIYGNRTKPPVPTWNVTVNGGLDPVIGSYNVGDWCRLVIQDDLFMRHRLVDYPQVDLTDPNQVGITKRIMAYSVTVPDVPQFPETVTLDLADDWVSTNA